MWCPVLRPAASQFSKMLVLACLALASLAASACVSHHDLTQQLQSAFFAATCKCQIWTHHFSPGVRAPTTSGSGGPGRSRSQEIGSMRGELRRPSYISGRSGPATSLWRPLKTLVEDPGGSGPPPSLFRGQLRKMWRLLRLLWMDSSQALILSRIGQFLGSGPSERRLHFVFHHFNK